MCQGRVVAQEFGEKAVLLIQKVVMGRVSVVFSAGVVIRAIDLSGDDMAMESVAISAISNGLGPGKQAKSEAGFVCFEG